MTLITRFWRSAKDIFLGFTARLFFLCGAEWTAREYFLRQLQHRSEAYGTTHPRTAYAMVFVSQTYPAERAVDRERQERLLTSAFLIFNKNFGPVSTEAAFIRHRLGYLRYKADKLDEALDFYREAHELYRQADTPWSLNHADLLELWAVALKKKTGQDAVVRTRLSEAKEIRRRHSFMMSRSRRFLWMKYRR